MFRIATQFPSCARATRSGHTPARCCAFLLIFTCLAALVIACKAPAPAKPKPTAKTAAKSTTQSPQQSPFQFKKRSQRGSGPVATPGGAQPDTAPRASRAQGGWSILVMTFTGEGAEQAARTALAQFQSQTGLSQGSIEPRGGGGGGSAGGTESSWVLRQGDYPSAEDPRAQSDLAVVRQLVPAAILVPPAVVADAGSLPEFDLSTLHQREGAAAKWTLQVAYYGHPDRSTPTEKELPQFRAAAEKAVLEFRRQGEESFYYHGPRGSTVTIGVFSDADQVNTYKDPITGKVTQLPTTRESMRLVETRRAHPLNLVNGAPFLVKQKGESQAHEQESFLVRVPGS